MVMLVPGAHACSCFSQEMREKTARETLALAQVAVFGRVVEVEANGLAKVVVLESFKGPPKDTAIVLTPGTGQCLAQPFTVGEEALVLSFHEVQTACDRHPKDHFLLDAFRSNAAK
ncbi:MAG: hypothetical protein HY021_01880 [Burkholderiales bacterium]|nr:hypothetical protein [Burkholderiales bacterium]